MKDIEEIKKAYEKELNVKPGSMPESLAHGHRLEELKNDMDNYEKEKHAYEVSNYDLLKGVKFTDQFGNQLRASVKPDWIDQTKVGETVVKYEVLDDDKQKHIFERKVTVSRFEITPEGLNDIVIPYEE